MTRSIKAVSLFAFVLLCACGPMLQRATGQPGRLTKPYDVQRSPGYLQAQGLDTLDLRGGLVRVDSAAMNSMYITAPLEAIVISVTANVYKRIEGLMSGHSRVNTQDGMKVTIARSGYYLCQYSASFTNSNNNTINHASVFKNAVDDGQIEAERKIGTGGDYGAMSAIGIRLCNAGDTLDVRFKSTASGDVTINHFNFTVLQIK